MFRFLFQLLSIACWLGAALFAGVLVIGVREIAGFPDAPQRVTLEGAIELYKGKVTPWVWLTDVTPDCSRLKRVSRSEGDVTLAVMRDAAGTEVVIEALGTRACNEIHPDDLYGLLRPLRDGEQQSYVKEGLGRGEGAGPGWVMCGYCDPSNSRGGLVLSAIVFGMLVWLALLFRKWKKRVEA